MRDAAFTKAFILLALLLYLRAFLQKSSYNIIRTTIYYYSNLLFKNVIILHNTLCY